MLKFVAAPLCAEQIKDANLQKEARKANEK